MPKTKEAFEEMRLKSRNHIMETALKLFSKKGYHATSISSIAKEAGIAAGLLYNYFSGKEDLLEKIMEENFQYIYVYITEKHGEKVNHAEEANHTEMSKMTEAAKDIRKLIDISFEAISSREESWKLLISVMFQPDVSKIAGKQISMFTLHQQELYKNYFITQGQKNPEESAKALASVMHGAFINYAYSGNSEEIRLLRRTVVERLISEGV